MSKRVSRALIFTLSKSLSNPTNCSLPGCGINSPLAFCASTLPFSIMSILSTGIFTCQMSFSSINEKTPDEIKGLANPLNCLYCLNSPLIAAAFTTVQNSKKLIAMLNVKHFKKFI